MHKLLLAGTVLALLSPYSYANDSAESSTELTPLVVTATRTPSAPSRLANAVTVIDREAILTSQAQSLAELLRSRGGVEVLDLYGDGSRASLGMRGFGENAASNTLILIDGQPLNNSDIGGPDLSRIRLDNIARIEILQGGSALWGNQAVGGVIHIITQGMDASYLQVDYGSYDSRDAQARVAHAGDGWSVALSGASRETDNYRDNNALARDQGALEGRIQGRLAQAWLRAEYSDEHLQTPGGLFAAEAAADRRQSAADFAGDYSDLRSLNLSAGVQADLGQNWAFTGQASRYAADGEFKLSFRGFPSSPATQDRRIVSLNPQWTYSYRSTQGEGHIAIGADLQRADYTLESQFGVQSNAQSSDDLYLSALIPLHARVTASLSGRHARIEDRIADPGPFAVLPDGQEFQHRNNLGSVGLNIRLLEPLSLLISFDQVLRYPKVDEYFGSGYTPDTIGLKPQTGDNFELGLQYQRAQVRASVVAFRLELDDEIVYDPLSFSNTNLDHTRRDGVNVQSNWRVTEKHSIDASYTYVDTAINGANRIPLVARQHGQISLNLGFAHGWSMYTQVQAAGDRLAGGDTDASADKLPGYAVVNLAARWQNGPLELGLKLANLLDKQYAEQGYEDGFSGDVASFPLPEFHAGGHLRYNF